jgi:polysaccharide deacetylase family protein (PEP-CTERM system associated)
MKPAAAQLQNGNLTPASSSVKCVFSIDVEDWFHINGAPGEPDCAQWDEFPSHVSRNFRALLELLAVRRVRATCFFLGWVAEKFPELVREARDQGHEIASHGYAHRLVHRQTPSEFLDDIRKARAILEDVSGMPVVGYRAPSFSVTAATPWFFDQLAEAGYRFDSSVFPAPRQNGGLQTDQLAPNTIKAKSGAIEEFPVSVTPLLGRPMCFFGGGYLRLFPYRMIKSMAKRVIGEGRPVIFYIHPREIDPQHPRLPMEPLRSFKCHVNLHTTRPKIERLLNDFSFATFGDLLARQTLQELH